MVNAIKIRKAVAKDFEEIFKLEKEFMEYNNSIEPNKFLHYKLNKSDVKKSFLKSLKEKDLVFLVLGDSKKLLGMFIGKIKSMGSNGFLYGEKRIGYIENVFISKQYRKRGYLGLFLTEFFRILKKNKVKYCNLHTDAHNKLAIAAYKKLGFKGPIQYKMIKEVK